MNAPPKRKRIDEIQTLRNLRHRPAKPALRRGRIQKAAERLLRDIGPTATTREVAEWGYAREILICGKRLRPADYEACRRALRQIGALPVRRAAGRGRPWVWQLDCN